MVPSTPTHPRVRRLAWPLLAVAAAAQTALVASGPLRSYDLWWHLAYGENVLDGLGLARVDSFSYTIPGTPVTNFQWLSQVVFAFVFRHGGVAGLVALRAGVLGLVPVFLVLAARARGASATAAALALVPAVLVMLFRNLVRPEIFSLLLLSFSLWVIASWMAGRRGMRWLLIPTMVLWVNLHAGLAITGLMLAFLALASDVFVPPRTLRTDRLGQGVLLGVLLTLSCLASPLGLDIGRVILRATHYDNTLVQNRDWMPFSLDLLSGAHPAPWIAFLGLALVLALLALLRGWRRMTLFDIAATLLLFLMALRLRRSAVSFALVAMPVVALLLTPWVQRMPGRLASLARPAIAVAALVALPLLAPLATMQRPRLALMPERFPFDATAWIRTHQPAGHVFHPYHFGGVFVHELRPDYPVYLDGRDHIFQEAGVTGRYYQVFRELESWREEVAQRGIGIVVWENAHNAWPPDEPRPLQHMMDRETWALVFHGPVSTIWLRRTPENAALIARHEYRRVRPGVLVNYVDMPDDPSVHGPALEDEVDRLLAESPNFAEPYLLRGRMLHVRHGRLAGACTAYRKAFELAPWRADVYHLIGSLGDRCVDDDLRQRLTARIHQHFSGQDRRELLERIGKRGN